MRYEFTFAHPLSETARAAFPELDLSRVDTNHRTLFGAVVDRAQLDGLMARAANLGLDIVDMHRLPD